MMSRINIKHLSKTFGGVVAVDDVSLTIDEGEFLTLLGPSGCGKTTTLRCIAGLELPDEGEIYVGDTCLYSYDQGIFVPPKDRKVGMVFQNYVLYPHMNVYRNVAFGLQLMKMNKNDIRVKVNEVLQKVGLSEYKNRYPRQLSGGQRQRVALARMIVRKPKILLFDEPFSNLDAALRASMRTELKLMLLTLDSTSVFVTHDQSEAMVLADRIAVMNNGRILQIGSPQEIYRFPESIFVAEFTGNPKTNIIKCFMHDVASQTILSPVIDRYYVLTVLDSPKTFYEDQVFLNVRPEDIELEHSPRSTDLKLNVYTMLPIWPETLVYLRFREGRDEIVVRGKESEYRELRPGQEVGIRVRRGNIYGVKSKRLIGSFGYGQLKAEAALRLGYT